MIGSGSATENAIMQWGCKYDYSGMVLWGGRVEGEQREERFTSLRVVRDASKRVTLLQHTIYATR